VNPYAYYDSLSIAAKLTERLGNTVPSEIHLFSYLACLLSLYRRWPVSDWGYAFAGTRAGGPFSSDIEEAIGSQMSSGQLGEANGLFRPTEAGQKELIELGQLENLSQREQFIDGACSSLLTLPIGMVRSAISHDPDISGASAIQSPRPLLQESALDELYDAFAVLSDKIGIDVKDLLIPATIWLTYLGEVAAAETRAPGGASHGED